MEQNQDIMRKRSAWVEHPFDTLKHCARMNHFLMRGLEKCRGEYSLMVLGYDFTGALNILDAYFVRDYCIQHQENRLENTKYA